MSKLIVTPHNEPGGGKTGTLASSLTVKQINEVLGFPPNCEDDPDKVKHSWGFKLENGEPCGIWDYKGTKWSTSGPDNVFEYLFPDHYRKGPFR